MSNWTLLFLSIRGLLLVLIKEVNRVIFSSVINTIKSY